MTDREIDALTILAGWAAVRGPLTESTARIARRMADAAGARYNWTHDQIDAAFNVACRVPIHAEKGGRMRGAEPLPAMIEAARRAVKP